MKMINTYEDENDKYVHILCKGFKYF